MRVSVDNDLCDARGQCNVVDPELFTLDEDGYSDIGQGKPVPAGKEDEAQLAADSCPELAISVD